MWCLKNIFVIFFEKQAMEKVEQMIEVSSKLGTIDKLRKVVFDPTVDYDVRRNFVLKHSVESSEVFWAMFQLQKKGKENVRRTVDSFEVLTEHKQIKKRTRIICCKF